MINVYIENSTKDYFSLSVEVLPRIGETVVIAYDEFTVTDIVHTLPDRYTNASIRLILEKK